MKKETTQQTYVEPEGFKGSKGRWFVEAKQKHLFPSVILGEHPNATFYKRPRIIINETDSSQEGSFEATAQLIAQSKELAKALQDMIKAHEDGGNIHYNDEYENAKQVLKDAGL